MTKSTDIYQLTTIVLIVIFAVILLRFCFKLTVWFGLLRKETYKKPTFLLKKMEDVKPNEGIMATLVFNNLAGSFLQNTLIDVLNNNPLEKKIFVRIWFMKDGEKNYEDRVYNYSDEIFKHFTTLNPVIPINIKDIKGVFQEELDAAILQEKYEVASIIRDAISKINALNMEKEAKNG